MVDRDASGGAGGSRWTGWLDDLGRDLRHTVRGLRRSPGFAAAVTLVLALGIGAATAMFSIVNGILLRPLPYPDPDAIVRVGASSRLTGNLSDLFLSNRSMPLLQENAESFEQLAAWQELRGERDGAVLRGARASPALFPLFRVPPHLGRLFLEEEARTGAPPVVLLSYRAWTNHFAADPDVVGTAIDLDGGRRLVVGVLAEGFHFPAPDTEFWLPYVIEPSTAEGAPGPGGAAVTSLVAFKAVGRLRPGVSAEQAEAEARGVLQEGGGATGPPARRCGARPRSRRRRPARRQ